jgi:hypothetical protein
VSSTGMDRDMCMQMVVVQPSSMLCWVDNASDLTLLPNSRTPRSTIALGISFAEHSDFVARLVG